MLLAVGLFEMASLECLQLHTTGVVPLVRVGSALYELKPHIKALMGSSAQSYLRKYRVIRSGHVCTRRARFVWCALCWSHDRPSETAPAVTRALAVISAVCEGHKVSAKHLERRAVEVYFALERICCSEHGVDVVGSKVARH